MSETNGITGVLNEREVDQDKLMSFLGKVVGDFGAAMSAILTYIGDKYGLYRTLAQKGPMNSHQLAQETGTTERYVREWLINQAAGGYISYDNMQKKYYLEPEQAVALTNEESPFFIAGGFQSINALMKSESKIVDLFKSGEGMRWGEHHHNLFEGTERFFKPGYVQNLVLNWLPSLEGVVQKLESGAKAADIGCGHGISTILMAKAFPNSQFFGFDNHEASIIRANEIAVEEGVSDRVKFIAASSTDFPGENYDLITYFDCLHDMGHPEDAMTHARSKIADDGTVMVVEPMAGKTVEENFNPVGRVYSAFSVLCCTPNAIADGGPALGTVASDDVLNAVANAGGFSRFRRAAETPFNRIFEIKA